MRGAGARDSRGRAGSPGDSARRRSIFWRSRSSRWRPARTGAKTICSIWCAARIRIATLDRARFRCRGRDAFRRHRDVARAQRGVSASRPGEPRVRGRRGARLAAITSGGAIPETAQYLVVAEPEGTTVGTLDEDFAVESLAGDVFLLGTTSWRIRRVEPGRVRVEDAHGAAPSIPFWRGEAPGRTRELSHEVSRLREDIAARPRDRDRIADAAIAGSTGAARSRPSTTCAPARRARRDADADTRRRRALLRRRRRHAVGDPRAVRRAHQSRVGPGAAQALLPLVQLRTAGRGHRQRHRAFR